MSAVNTTPSSRPSFLLLSEIAAAVMLLAACGGGGDAPAGDANATEASASAAASTEAASDAEVAQIAAARGQDASPRPDDEVGSSTPETEVVSDDSAVLDLANPYTDDVFIATTAAQEAESAAAPVAEEATPAGEIVDNVSVDPVDSQRETAQATYATPRVAALDYSGDLSSTRLALLARHKLVLLALGKSSSTITNALASIRRQNSSIKIGQYVITNEVPCSTSSSHQHYPLVQAVNRANWWLRNASGSRVQWNTAYGACDINITSYAPRNSSGQTYAQYKWAFDWNAKFKPQPNLNYVFIDGFHRAPRVTADWNRDRVNESPSQSWVQSAYRKGQVAYVNAVRATTTRLKVMGNSDGDLSQPEYREVLDGAFMEGMMGKSWSYESCCGWKRALDYYRTNLRNTRGANDVIFQTYANPTDYRMVRYGLATAMMDNGYFMYSPLSYPLQPKWFDEFSAQIGTPVDAPPTGPAQNGIWKRRYTNGIVLVNPSRTSSASISVGSGYKRLSGTQDRTVNNGARQSTVTLPPRSGLLMIRG